MPTYLGRPANPRLSDDLVDRWRSVPSAVAADQLAGRGHPDPAIRPLRAFDGAPHLVGSVVTAWCEPGDYGSVHHAIAAAGAGDVIAIAAGGRRDIAVIGELLGGAARRKGIAGVVVDGGVRDIATIRSWPDFHMFSRWVTPRGPTTMERGSVNEPIVFGGVAVSPGDLLIGDDDGLVFVPHDLAESLLPACLARVAAEIDWQAALDSGRTTIETFGVPPAVARP
jgi:4-hydroxy-4-methyl-2-oxoglutarate aldolase